MHLPEPKLTIFLLISGPNNRLPVTYLVVSLLMMIVTEIRSLRVTQSVPRSHPSPPPLSLIDTQPTLPAVTGRTV